MTNTLSSQEIQLITSEGFVFDEKNYNCTGIYHSSGYSNIYRTEGFLQGTIIISPKEKIIPCNTITLNFHKGKLHGFQNVEYYIGHSSLYIIKCRYDNGKRIGPFEEWYKVNGFRYPCKYKIKCNYDDGKLHGLFEEWYENERQKIKCSYKNGVYDGVFEEWYETGELKTRIKYIDGVIDNSYIDVFPNTNEIHRLKEELNSQKVEYNKRINQLEDTITELKMFMNEQFMTLKLLCDEKHIKEI